MLHARRRKWREAAIIVLRRSVFGCVLCLECEFTFGYQCADCTPWQSCKWPLCCGLHGVQEARATPEWFESHSKIPSWLEPNSIDPTADCCIETPTCTGNNDRDLYPDVQCDISNGLHLNALKPNSDRIIGRTPECCCTCEPTQAEQFKACV